MLHQIGVGALGPVFRTYEPTRDRLIAVKVFRLDVTPEQAQALADELSRAADAGLFHPSIVEPIAAGVEGTVAYRAEEYVAAESLDVAMRHYAPAALDKTLPFITQLAGAIDFARAAGVGHGALHPRDVFVTPDEARATGFGVVEALERIGMRAPVRRPYSAPERVAGLTWNVSADVFSLAAITYELLTAKRPSGTGDQIGPLSGDNVAGGATALRAVLARAMHEDPAKRYPTALAFAAALEVAAGGEQTDEAISEIAPIAAPAAIIAAASWDPGGRGPGGQRAGETGAVDGPDDLDEDEEDEEDEEPIEEEGEGPVEDEDEIDAEAADDIAAERDEDEALHDLMMRESEAAADPDLNTFDEERQADIAFTASQLDRFVDDFSSGEPGDHVLRRDSPDLLDLNDEIIEEAPEVVEAAVVPDPRPIDAVEEEVREDLDFAPMTGAVGASDAGFYRGVTQRERPRPAMLPMALMLMVGLLVGFVAGYAILGRDKASPPAAAADTPADSAAASAQGARQPSGKAYSEQAIAPPAAGQPPVTPPAVPEDAPATPTASLPPAVRGAAATARRGRIVVQSSPRGAAVTINGRWRGRTPLTLDGLAFGPYTVRVVQSGYAMAREEFSLSAASPVRTMSVRLRRGADTAKPAAAATTGAGSIYVDSRPRGARVLMDGRPVGVTPLRIPNVSAGTHTVRLELADHRTWVTSIRVSPGQERPVTGSLERVQ